MNMSETSEPFVDTIQGWDVSVGENGHEPAMGTTSEEERPLICVEVLIKPSSTLSDSDVALQVRKFIKVRLFGQRSRPLPVGQFVTIKDLNFQLKITGGPLADHVDQISFEESEGKLAVMLSCFADARWGVYCFKVESDPPTAESSGEDIPSAVHRILPNREYLQLWESLLYDSSIKSDLLKYATDTVLFSKLGIDSNLVTWNKVILLHGPPGTGKTSLCKALAQKLSIRLSEHYPGVYLIEINSHSLFSRWFSESGKLVMKMFQGIENIVKQNNALVCLLIDEVESLARARQAAVSGNEPSDAVRAVNALLTQIDKIKQYPNVLILTTSNMSEAIDLAFVDRADIKQYIGNPSEDAIICIYISSLEELMKREVLSSDPALVSSEENHVRSLIRKIARISNGLSGRSLRKIPFLTHAQHFSGKIGISLIGFLEAMALTVGKHQMDSKSLSCDNPVG